MQIQTEGGAAFQKGTVCTIATYAPEDPQNGGGAIGYSARKDTPSGNFVNATGMYVLTYLGIIRIPKRVYKIIQLQYLLESA